MDRSIIDPTPRDGSLFPLIPMDRRVPDMLHMIKNVTLWMLKNTAAYVYERPSTSAMSRIELKALKNKQIKWIDDIIAPFINELRSISSSNDGIPQ